ncbi:MAG: hypothetical protein VX244_00830 [Candidatus Neomarinimicrobiota bacterium]|nr:hypothetical protein [Candidatus Neomarinimicrobiota bacterium]
MKTHPDVIRAFLGDSADA